MVNNGTKENQHYVPKLLLRNFAICGSAKRGADKVHVFDKASGKSFVSNVRNVAAQFDFYDIQLGEQRSSIEESLSELESRASRSLAQVLKERSIGNLSASDRTWLAIFCAVQFMRTQSVRDQVTRMNGALEAHIKKMGFNPSAVEGFRSMTPEDVKSMTVLNLIESLRSFPSVFNAKAWFLMEAPSSAHFYIGDHPISLHNDRKFGPYRNLGIAVPGIQINLPIAPDLTLAMWDPAVLEMLASTAKESHETRMQILKLENPAQEHAELIATALVELNRSISRTDELITAARIGGIVKITEENVSMLNSLQVRHASRFVMSTTDDFGLVRKMLADNPEFRTTAGDGLRFD